MWYNPQKPPQSRAPQKRPPEKGDADYSRVLTNTDFENTFGLIRILGNDLPPRHSTSQTIDVLEQILTADPPLDNCTKIFLLNKISNQSVLAALRGTLEDAGIEHHVIPFDLGEYSLRPTTCEGFPEAGFLRSNALLSENEFVVLDAQTRSVREKILYAMDINGARNLALDIGQARFQWTLPFDGQTFFGPETWANVLENLSQTPSRYAIFPMKRGGVIDEPQLGFCFDASERFDENMPYGRRNKVDMLMQLGVPGPHQQWSRFVWDFPHPELSRDAGDYCVAGVVKRLVSGVSGLDDLQALPRAKARMKEILRQVATLDSEVVKASVLPSGLGYYAETSASRFGSPSTVCEVAAIWEKSRNRIDQYGRQSVLDKAEIAPRGRKNDYFSIEPHW